MELRPKALPRGDSPGPGVAGVGQWRLVWRRLRHDKAAMAGAGVIVIIVTLALAAPALAALTGHGPTEQFPETGISASGAPTGPGRAFWLGADELGRDLFIRVLYGARVSLFVGVMASAIGTVLGVGAGLAAGYHGGWIDMTLSRVIDSVLAFPYVVLALALTAAVGPSLAVVTGVISFFAWAGIARVVRGETISLRERDYVDAARSLGAGAWRIMFVEIFPNLIGPVLVLATLSIPSAIIFEATLSFLGLGIQPPAPSWGNILAGAENYYGIAWWYLLFPALALLATTFAFNLLGEGIRDALEPDAVLAASRASGRKRRRPARPGPADQDAPQGTLAKSGTHPTVTAVPAVSASRTEFPQALHATGRATHAAGYAGAIASITRKLRTLITLLPFLIRRVIAGVVVLWVVSLGTFLLFFTRPAISVARSMAGKEPTTAQLREIIRQLGLDRPIIVQYWQFLDRLLHGNLGYSYTSGEPVTAILAQDLPRTASLVGGGVLLGLIAGIAIGLLSATFPRSVLDRMAAVGVLAGLSVPTFVLGQLLLLGVFLQLNEHGITWIQDGYVGPTQSLSAWAGHMVLPWITVAAGLAAAYSRLLRSTLLETLGEDYIRTARAKGLTERRVIGRHALRSALAPVTSQLGIDVGTLLGGAVVTESVFGIGGVGQDSVQAIDAGNLPVIIGFVLVAALFVVTANIVVDFCYALLDPRVGHRPG